MREIRDCADAVVEEDPRALFAAITDIDRLPEWNGAIEKVIKRPERVAAGASWTVQMHPSRGVRWKSVSTLQELDPSCLRLAYRTVNADGNPSYTLWHWELTSNPAGRTSRCVGTSTWRPWTDGC